jgi:phosphoribosyl 1,2-cyclic phosphate phosphodiesterase
VKVRILGSGTSSGVPRVGNDWGRCDPTDTRNNRTRASILVSLGGYRILVDTSPDLRTQLLAAEVGDVDAVIWTHDHADHCHGLDDLRQVAAVRRQPVAGYARDPVLGRLFQRFRYAFEGNYGYPALIEPMTLHDRQAFGPIDVSAIEMPHGPVQATGLRFSDGAHAIGYATDFSVFTDEMADFFDGVDLFVIDALRRYPHPTHPHLEMTLAAVARCGVPQAYITHMDNTMDYAELADELPPGVWPAYDGLEVAL